MREYFGMSLFDVSKNEREKRILSDPALDETLRILLIRLGVTPRLRGYDYLSHAIKLGVAHRGYLNSVTTKIYPVVAEKYGVEAAVVERNIRHAIEVVIERDRTKRLNEFLGAEVFSSADRPTNAEVISLVADKISADLRAKEGRAPGGRG